MGGSWGGVQFEERDRDWRGMNVKFLNRIGTVSSKVNLRNGMWVTGTGWEFEGLEREGKIYCRDGNNHEINTSSIFFIIIFGYAMFMVLL
jgi:hypothetical protein